MQLVKRVGQDILSQSIFQGALGNPEFLRDQLQNGFLPQLGWLQAKVGRSLITALASPHEVRNGRMASSDPFRQLGLGGPTELQVLVQQLGHRRGSQLAAEDPGWFLPHVLRPLLNRLPIRRKLSGRV